MGNPVTLTQVLLAALAIVFIHSTTWDGMINAWLRRLLYRAPIWIRKPLYLCPICMTSFWGTLLWLQPFDFITYLFAVGGILTLISPLIPEEYGI